MQNKLPIVASGLISAGNHSLNGHCLQKMETMAPYTYFKSSSSGILEKFADISE